MEQILGQRDYVREDFEEMCRRYEGFGKDIYTKLRLILPSVFDRLTYYRATTYQTEDSYAVYKDGTAEFAIQLDPLCEVIVLWNSKTQIEIGTWSTDEYSEAIDFIRGNLLI
jgi:hypothetical protein